MPGEKNLEDRIITCVDSIKDSVSTIKSYMSDQHIIDIEKLNQLASTVGKINIDLGIAQCDNTIRSLEEFKKLLRAERRRRILVAELEEKEKARSKKESVISNNRKAKKERFNPYATNHGVVTTNQSRSLPNPVDPSSVPLPNDS